MGTADGGGTKLICLSGHIKNRGLYEVNLGTPLEEIIYGEQYGGGSATGRALKFIHFGGQSGPIGAVATLRIVCIPTKIYGPMTYLSALVQL